MPRPERLLCWPGIALLTFACRTSEPTPPKPAEVLVRATAAPQSVCAACAKPPVAAGDKQSLALKRDGTVWAWGLVAKGQSDRQLPLAPDPEQVLGLTGATAVSAGKSHALVLQGDGTVWGWGDNRYGQLGNDSTRGSFEPTPVIDLADAVAVAAGRFHSLAVKRDGTVWAWGFNGEGQLGEGDLPDGPGGQEQLSRRHGIRQRQTPVQVIGLHGVVAVAAGGNSSVALRDDGTVWAWGQVIVELPDDGGWTLESRSLPVQVAGLTEVTAVAIGSTHTVAMKSDGTLWVWGGNSFGELGNGTTKPYFLPAPVPGLTDVAAVGAGDGYTVALKRDGSVWSWGKNRSGQLGAGTTTKRSAPAPVEGLTDVLAIAVGDDHTVAVKRDGTAWAWGSNAAGQLGDTSVSSSPIPVQVKGLTGLGPMAANEPAPSP